MTTREEKLKELQDLKSELTGDMFQDMELMDKILEIEKELGIIQVNTDSPFECEGCGS